MCWPHQIFSIKNLSIFFLNVFISISLILLGNLLKSLRDITVGDKSDSFNLFASICS
ncbi:hypothetical protein O3M35_008831 [Rhynocoris fuscipes]|uniref:Uncharacterized protein n=1 Tax=Rhynocoris fuscipes TaxID=488301 RepID=A0AAW1DEM7_9HEMI